MADKKSMQWSQVLLGSLRQKIMLAVSVMLILACGAVVYVSTDLGLDYSKDSARATVYEMAQGLNHQFLGEVRSTLARGRAYALQSDSEERLNEVFRGDTSLLGLQLVDVAEKRVERQALQPPLTALDAPDQLGLTTLKRGPKGFPIGYEMRRIGATTTHRLVTVLSEDDGHARKVMVLYLNPKVFEGSFGLTALYEKFLFDAKGRIVARSEENPSDGIRVAGTMPSALLEGIRSFGEITNGQVTLNLQDAGGEVIGHFYRTEIGGLYVAVLTPTQKLYDNVYKVARLSTYLGMAILTLALVLAFIFADTLIQPILRLVGATERIAQGDFSVRTKPTTRDEIAALTKSFNLMAEGLNERERMKDIFGKLHSKPVFQKLLKEDKIRLGGEKIPVTVFFSDIRSFTSSSEKMLPEHVVEMLNEYMSEMVAVIEKHDGVVDKYVGDAIMAVWGMARPTEGESNPSDDATKAVAACLEMRQKLAELNKRRRARGHPPIQIGMGLNSGEVIAGTIGSPSRMEYTVIGDTVNTASRMESLTKEMKTDFLVQESTVLLSKAAGYSFEGPFEVEAKGKAGTVKVFKCPGGPVPMAIPPKAA